MDDYKSRSYGAHEIGMTERARHGFLLGFRLGPLVSRSSAAS